MTLLDVLLQIVLPIITLIAGGGWFINWRAARREKNGEAMSKEAEGWKAMQDLYQQTIADFNTYSEDMRKERSILKEENHEMREKYKAMSEDILHMKKDLARQGRKIEAMSPFLCSVIDCVNRKRVNISLLTNDEPKD